MTTVQPERGNQFFSQVENTVVTPSSVLNATSGQAQLQLIEGSVTPVAAATNYAIVDSNGNTLKLPVGAVISSVVATGAITAGATSIATLGMSATDGGSVAVAFATGVDIDSATPFANGLALVLTGAGPTTSINQFVSLTSGAAVPSGGALSVRITYYVEA